MKKTAMFLMMLSLCSCGNRFDPIELEKVDYNGIELIMNGYYIDRINDENKNYRTIYFFYRDGTTLDGGTYPADEFSIEDIEENFRSESFDKGIKKYRTSWGVFNIIDDNIEFELWASGNGKTKTVIRSGKILDQKTFVITDFYNNYSESNFTRNDTFHFTEFIPKPDSTNIFLE